MCVCLCVHMYACTYVCTQTCFDLVRCCYTDLSTIWLRILCSARGLLNSSTTSTFCNTVLTALSDWDPTCVRTTSCCVRSRSDSHLCICHTHTQYSATKKELMRSNEKKMCPGMKCVGSVLFFFLSPGGSLVLCLRPPWAMLR